MNIYETFEEMKRLERLEGEQPSRQIDENVGGQTTTCEITDFDIATIEVLHDLLLDNHGYKLDHITLTSARKLTAKMYDAFKSA